MTAYCASFNVGKLAKRSKANSVALMSTGDHHEAPLSNRHSYRAIASKKRAP
jgi:hypothetical protein